MTLNTSEACPCCLADFGEKDVLAKMPCGHQMHIACFAQYQERDTLVSRGCPFCARKFEKAEMRPSNPEPHTAQESSAPTLQRSEELHRFDMAQTLSALNLGLCTLEYREAEARRAISTALESLRRLPDQMPPYRMGAGYVRGGRVSDVFVSRDVHKKGGYQ